MNEINDKENKPTCLILDEVDGALGGAEGNQSTGLKFIADFLTKCLKSSTKKPKASNQKEEINNSSDSDDPMTTTA